MKNNHQKNPVKNYLIQELKQGGRHPLKAFAFKHYMSEAFVKSVTKEDKNSLMQVYDRGIRPVPDYYFEYSGKLLRINRGRYAVDGYRKVLLWNINPEHVCENQFKKGIVKYEVLEVEAKPSKQKAKKGESNKKIESSGSKKKYIRKEKIFPKLQDAVRFETPRDTNAILHLLAIERMNSKKEGLSPVSIIWHPSSCLLELGLGCTVNADLLQDHGEIAQQIIFFGTSPAVVKGGREKCAKVAEEDLREILKSYRAFHQALRKHSGVAHTPKAGVYIFRIHPGHVVTIVFAENQNDPNKIAISLFDSMGGDSSYVKKMETICKAIEQENNVGYTAITLNNNKARYQYNGIECAQRGLTFVRELLYKKDFDFTYQSLLKVDMEALELQSELADSEAHYFTLLDKSEFLYGVDIGSLGRFRFFGNLVASLLVIHPELEKVLEQLFGMQMFYKSNTVPEIKPTVGGVKQFLGENMSELEGIVKLKYVDPRLFAQHLSSINSNLKSEKIKPFFKLLFKECPIVYAIDEKFYAVFFAWLISFLEEKLGLGKIKEYKEMAEEIKKKPAIVVVNPEAFSQALFEKTFDMRGCQNFILKYENQNFPKKPDFLDLKESNGANLYKEKIDESMGSIKKGEESVWLLVTKNIVFVLGNHYDKNLGFKIKNEQLIEFLIGLLARCVRIFKVSAENKEKLEDLSKSISKIEEIKHVSILLTRTLNRFKNKRNNLNNNLRSSSHLKGNVSKVIREEVDNSKNLNNNLFSIKPQEKKVVPLMEDSVAGNKPKQKKKREEKVESEGKEKKEKTSNVDNLIPNQSPLENIIIEKNQVGDLNKNSFFSSVSRPKIATEIIKLIYFRLDKLNKKWGKNILSTQAFRESLVGGSLQYDKVNFLHDLLSHVLTMGWTEEDLNNVPKKINSLLKQYPKATQGHFSATRYMLKKIRDMLVKENTKITKKQFNL